MNSVTQLVDRHHNGEAGKFGENVRELSCTENLNEADELLTTPHRILPKRGAASDNGMSGTCRQICMGKIACRQVTAPQTALRQLNACQIRPFEHGVVQIGVLEVGLMQPCMGEVGVREVGAG